MRATFIFEYLDLGIGGLLVCWAGGVMYDGGWHI